MAQPIDLSVVVMHLLAKRLGYDPLRQVVELLEVLPVRGRKLTRMPHVVQGEFVGRPLPHAFRARHFGVEGVGRQRPFGGDTRLDGLAPGRIQHRAVPPRPLDTRLLAAKLSPPHRIKFHRQHRGIVREVLEQPAFVCQQPVEHWLAVTLIAAPDDVVMGAGDHANRIELHKSEPLDDCQNVQRAGRCGGQAQAGQPHPAGRTIVNP